MAYSTYDPVTETIPKHSDTQSAIISIIENTCNFGDLILRHPDISDRILQSKYEPRPGGPRKHHWRDTINWCLQYTKYFYGRIVDEKNQEHLALTYLEINPDKRPENYSNPYRDVEDREREKRLKQKKPPKKLKKGPQLQGGRTEL